MQPWYEWKLRALRKVKEARCPGEEYCTTNQTYGMVARAEGRTLENYCHAAEGGCPLYCTKTGTTPFDLVQAVQAAEELREEFANTGRIPDDGELTAWEKTAYKAAMRAVRAVENDPPEGKGKVGEQLPPTGDATIDSRDKAIKW